MSFDLGTTTRELFVEGDRAVVYTSNGNAGRPARTATYCSFAVDGTTTNVSVFDISNRNEPKLTRELHLSGSLMAPRRIASFLGTSAPNITVAALPIKKATLGDSRAEERELLARRK